MPTRTYSNIVIAIIATRVNDSAVRSVLATSHCLFLFLHSTLIKLSLQVPKAKKKSTRLVWVWVSSIENNRQNNPREIQRERETSTSKESEQAMNGHRERTYTRTERDWRWIMTACRPVRRVVSVKSSAYFDSGFMPAIVLCAVQYIMPI